MKKKYKKRESTVTKLLQNHVKESKSLKNPYVVPGIEKVITMKKPKTRYVITGRKWMDFILPGILPDRWLDKVFAKFLGIDKERI